MRACVGKGVAALAAVVVCVGGLVPSASATLATPGTTPKDTRDASCVDFYTMFRDVDGSTPHARDIQWLACQGITTGYPDGTYRGMTPVYRQDMAAFLRRYAESKGVGQYESWKPDWNRFKDVNRATPHGEDILWLADHGITEGWPERDGRRTFRGMTPVLRQDMAAFLHRIVVKAGGHETDTTSNVTSFTDVDASTPHAGDINWLVRNSISTGYANPGRLGTYRFGGMTRVYRQDMAAFLSRVEMRTMDCTRTIPAKTHEEQKLVKDAWVETKTTPAHTETVVIEPARIIHHEAVTHTEPEYGYVEVWVDVFPDGYTCEGDEVLNMSFEEMEKHGGSYASHIEYRWQQTGEKEVIDMEAWDEFVPAKTEEKYIPEKVETIPHEAEYETVTVTDEPDSIGPCPVV